MNVIWRRVIPWSTAGLVLAGAVLFALRPQPVPVDLAGVKPGPLVVTVDEEGKTRVRDRFIVSAPVRGHARRIDLDVGDPVVAERTSLAEIEPGDPEFLDERARAEAQADLAAAEAARLLARAELDEARAELEFARAQLDRARRLARSATISEQALEDAERAFKTRRASVRTAEAALRVREHDLVRARSRLTSPVHTHAQASGLEYVVMTAPVTGTVLQVFHESEGVVEAGAPLLELGDPANLEIVTEMLSTDAVKVAPGQRVIIERWGGDEPLEGKVTRVEPFGFTKISALGIEEQRVNVIVQFSSPQERWRTLRHGFRVEVRVVIWESDEALTVPLTALFRGGEAWAVFVDDDGIARQRLVQVGHRAGLEAEITGGLEEGERVVVSPSDRIRDGVRIQERRPTRAGD